MTLSSEVIAPAGMLTRLREMSAEYVSPVLVTVCILISSGCNQKVSSNAPSAPSKFNGKGLILSPEQQATRASIEAVKNSGRKQFLMDLASKRREMRALWTNSGPPERATVLGKQAEIESIRGRLREVALDAELATWKLYTSEQKIVATQPTYAGCIHCCESCNKGDCNFECGDDDEPLDPNDPGPGPGGPPGDVGCSRDHNQCSVTWCKKRCVFNANTGHCECIE
jgi:hypothetical protein